ncbi:MAG TPA: ATP-binding protein [Methylomirabilota bacterium]|nr:ATP-binding protein [Methylomirabilota bacterium]
MAAFAARFSAVAGHPDVSPLARDGRAAIAFDRSGAQVLWANSAGLGCLGVRDPSAVTALSAASATAKRIASLAGRLAGDAARVERIPLPMGIVPVQATCGVRRIVVDGERIVLVVVADGTGRIGSAAAAAGYDAILAALSPEPPPLEPEDEARPTGEAPAFVAAPDDAGAISTEIFEAAEPEDPTERHFADLTEPVAGALPVEPAPPIDDGAAGSQAMDTAREPETAHDAGIADDAEPDEAIPEVLRHDEPMPALAGNIDPPDIADNSAPAEHQATAPASASEDAAPDDADDGRFRFAAHGRTVRFVFELDPASTFTFVSPELSEIVGPRSAAVEGRDWTDVAEALQIDPLGRIGAALGRRDTFTSLTVDWPVDDVALLVPVDLAGMPVFGRDRSFLGYRGFGVAKCGAAFEAPVRREAEALAAPQPLTPEELAAGSIVVEAETEDAAATVDIEPGSDGVSAGVAEAGVEDTAGPDESVPVTDEAGSEDVSVADDAPQAILDDASEADDDVSDDMEPSDMPPEDDTDDLDELALLDGGEPPTADGGEPRDGDAADAEDKETEDGETDGEETDGEEPPPPHRPEPADDLGDDWPATVDVPPEPADDPEVFEPGEPIGDEEADLAALAAVDAASPADIAAASMAETPPVEDPAAPDAAADVGPNAPVRLSEPLTDQLPVSLDLEWRDPKRPTGEVIQSPIVPRSVPQQVLTSEETTRRQLSRPEREAFQKIAEALGARFEDGSRGEVDGGSPASESDGSSNGTAPPRLDIGIDAPLPLDPIAEIAPLPIDVAVLDRLPVAIAILKDGEAVTVNRAFLHLAGSTDRASLDAAGGFADAFAGSALPRDASLPAIRRRDGIEIPVSAKLHSIPWQGGIASLLVVQDTAAATGRDRAEIAEARVDELEAILDTATDGVLVLDAKGVVLAANRSAEALFGTDRSRMVGDPVLNLLAPESHRAALDYLDGLSRNGVASVLNDGREVIGRVQQGGLVPLFMTVGRISSAKFCAVLRDITQWKRAEEELTNAKRSAETASSQKSDFLAKISHEIRTPLNAIIGFSEVMMEERFGPVGSDRYKEYLRDIHSSGAHIMSLVNDLLDLSKIEAGKLDLAFEAVPANEVIRECVALMQPQANRERVIIRTSLSSSLPNVVADNRSLRQIVLNLVSNAIKFNAPGGQVIVSTIYEENGEVAIRVRDTGMGMSEDDIGKALEPFRQLHTTRPGRGTGLGLPLTKALVEANRAAFRIESALGQGTLVQITFPSTRVLAE